MIKNLNEILKEWAYRVDNGQPNPKNSAHLYHLSEILIEYKWPFEVIEELLQNLNEDDIVKKKQSDGSYGSPYTVKNHNPDRGQELVKKDASPEDIKNVEKGEEPKDKKPKKKKPSTRGVSSESIDSIDGDDKQRTMDGKEKPPGTETSLVAEIGVGYSMACLSENNNNMAAAEKCLKKKLSESKLGDKHGTSDSKKELRRGMLQSAKRENQRVKEINKELGWKNSQTAHIGGSKASLQSVVDKLREKGITEVNGIPLDEYEKIILGGGGGENPTDTMVCVINEETGEAIMYHTSNKMSSNDIISNGSPAKEIREVISEAKDYSEDERKQAQQAGKEARENIGKHRAAQKKYIQQQQDKIIEDSEDLEIVRTAIDRLQGKKDPVSTSATEDKYWQMILSHKSVVVYMKEKGYNKNNLTSEQEVEIYQFYVRQMKKISSMENPPDNRSGGESGGVGAVDIQIMTRLYGEGQEEITTGKEPRKPIFIDKEMKSFYDEQTIEINTLREKMNKIKPGSGDQAYADRMAKRLHLDSADGHDPGGIPNDRVETVMGVYDYKDLQQDLEGNMVQKKGSKFYKLDKEGKITDEEVNSKDVQDFDCAIVADKGTMSHCLGMKEGDKSSDDIGITMGEYEGTKAIIYDRNGNQIGVQTARSKTGPGGAMQDSIAYHRDFQRCLAKQTKLQEKCG